MSSCSDDNIHTRGSPRLRIGVRPLEIMANCDLISSAGQHPGYSLAGYRISEATHTGLRQGRVLGVVRLTRLPST